MLSEKDAQAIGIIDAGREPVIGDGPQRLPDGLFLDHQLESPGFIEDGPAFEENQRPVQCDVCVGAAQRETQRAVSRDILYRE